MATTEKTYTSSFLICRSCCLPKVKEKMKPLSTKLTIDSIFDIPPNTSVLELFVYCTKLPAGQDEDDTMPQSVCTVCLKKLLATYEFLRECDATEAKLRATTVFVVADKLEGDDAINFDDIIALDTKQEDERPPIVVDADKKDENLTEIMEEPPKQDLDAYDFLNSPASTAPDQAKDVEEYLDPEYLDESLPDHHMVVCGICNTEMLFENYADHCAQEHIEQVEATPKTPGHLTCDECGEHILAKRFEDHMTGHENVTKTFVCQADGCEKAFYLEKSLRAHRTVHAASTFLCPVCGKNCNDRRQLYVHEKQHHGYNEKSKRRADCTVCGVSITVKDMKAHLRRHTGERPYACKTCGKTFAQSGTMRTHELRHQKQRPNPCTMCDKTFARPAMLLVHLRSHTGERPFGCASCSKRFARKDLLVIHERKHTGSKPYRCDECGKCFSILALMKEHRYSHNENQLKCNECPECFTYPRQLKKHLKEQHNFEAN